VIVGNDTYGVYEQVIDEQGTTSTAPWVMKGNVSVFSLMVKGYIDFDHVSTLELSVTTVLVL
jgi:hypothetical protein